MLDQMLVAQVALSSCPGQSCIKNLYTRKHKGIKSPWPSGLGGGLGYNMLGNMRGTCR